MQPGRAVNGNIEFAGDTDWYRLPARTGQRYQITLNGRGIYNTTDGGPCKFVLNNTESSY